jgi:putative oxidoreductase
MLNELMLLQSVAVVFAAILFLQSGLDKLINYGDNLQYISSVFAKTGFNKISTVLFVLITVMEITTAMWSVFGAVMLLWKGDAEWARRALMMGTATLLCLFAGQRVAKDYAGAAGIVPYILVFLFGMFLLGLPPIHP